MTQTIDTTNKSSPLLDRLLNGRSEEYKRKVLELVNYCGITDFNDPMFLFLLATGQLQVMLKDAPDNINEVFEQRNKEVKEVFSKWAKEITLVLTSVERGIVLRQQNAIAEAAKELLKKSIKEAERAEQQRLFKSVLPASGIIAAVLGLGCFMGMTVPSYLQGGYVGTRNVTAQEAESLKWAMSPEGQKARQLMEWNRDYLSVCEKDAKALGVKLTFGKQQAEAGYCILWTRPPEQRGLKVSKN